MKLKDTLAQIERSLAPKINNALAKEVLDKVNDTEGKAIYEEVYAMNTSGRYQRRWDNGGLLDPDSVKGTVKDGVLTVTNEAKPNLYKNGINRYGGTSTTPASASLASIVENGTYNPHGAGYDWWEGAEPRPFTKKTVETLKANKAHVAALKAGLQRQGIKVK